MTSRADIPAFKAITRFCLVTFLFCYRWCGSCA